MSAAGPLTNLTLGLLGVIAIKLALFTTWDHFISLNFFYLVARFNLALCLFNLLPCPPLDGFHIASEFFPELKPLKNSQMGSALFMILFITDIGRVFFEVADIMIKAFLS